VLLQLGGARFPAEQRRQEALFELVLALGQCHGVLRVHSRSSWLVSTQAF
jgi:hypothetical protein